MVITDGAPALTKNTDKILSCKRLRCNWNLWLGNLQQRYAKLFSQNQDLRSKFKKWFETYDRSNFEIIYTQLKADLKENDVTFLEPIPNKV